MIEPLASNYRRLAAAIVKRGALDARSDRAEAPEAQRWLAVDPLAGYLLDVLNLDRERVAVWVETLEALAQPALL